VALDTILLKYFWGSAHDQRPSVKKQLPHKEVWGAKAHKSSPHTDQIPPMTSQRLHVPPLKTAALISLAVLGLVYAWFWTVISHRIAGQPYSGFASVFVTGCGDFEHFYHGARAMRDGTDLYTSGVRGYIYPPFIAFLFTPLTYFSVQTAAWIMLVINLALGLACAWGMSVEVMRRLDMDISFDSVIVTVAITTLLSATKLRSEFQMWQTNILLMTALVYALRFLDERPRLAGMLLGLAFNIKYLPIVFLPYLLMRRRFAAAAWFVIGILAFALAPALVSGWNENLHHWAVALSGMAHLVGITTTVAEVANVDPITAGHSISITSGLSRIMSADASPSRALILAGGIAIATAVVLWRIYSDKSKPLFAWPSATEQTAQPFRGMIALEWAALMTLALAFSPQTNPRHASMLLMAFAPLAAMLCFPRIRSTRWPAMAAAAILYFGIAFPPNTPEFLTQLVWWRHVGGAGWCMLLMLPFYFVAGFGHLDALAGLRRSAEPLVPRMAMDLSAK